MWMLTATALLVVWPAIRAAPDLVINVGIETGSEQVSIYRQTISGNSSTDTVTLEYEEPDGTAVTQLTDFRTQTQMTRIAMSGEEELGEPVIQILCFITAFTGDLIPPEAVMKLRQKHPGTVRIADSDEGEIVQDSQLTFKYFRSNSYQISSHLASLCKDAKSTTYTSSHELHAILRDNKRADINALTDDFPNYDSLPRCWALLNEVDDGQCQCTRQIMLYWYPCALKYCRNKDGEGEHRCGIRTCRKTMSFRYPVKSKHFCHWDET